MNQYKGSGDWDDSVYDDPRVVIIRPEPELPRWRLFIRRYKTWLWSYATLSPGMAFISSFGVYLMQPSDLMMLVLPWSLYSMALSGSALMLLLVYESEIARGDKVMLALLFPVLSLICSFVFVMVVFWFMRIVFVRR